MLDWNPTVGQGNLDAKQAIAPYKLYPVTVTNELTTSLKEKRGAPPKEKVEGEEEGGRKYLFMELLVLK